MRGGRGCGCSLPLITRYKSKAREPLTLLVVWETRCNLRLVPGADRSCARACTRVCVRVRAFACTHKGGSVACKSTKTDHSASPSLMKTLCVSYTRWDNRREKTIGTIRQRKWQMKWASAVAKPGHWCVHYQLFTKQEGSESNGNRMNNYIVAWLCCNRWIVGAFFVLVFLVFFSPCILSDALCLIWPCAILQRFVLGTRG